jgi:hypothetical protein
MSSTAVAVREASPATALSRSSEFNLVDVMRLAEMLMPTGMLPEHIKSPGGAVAIILTGRELGMEPMRALRSLNLVKGKVTENADSQLARFKSDGGRAKWISLDETKGVLFLKHPNGDEHTETFTMQDAERAGLTKPSRNKDGRETPSMFTKYPKAMIRSRTITAGLKSVGWEGGAGTYDPSELSVPEAEVEEEKELTLEEALSVPLRGAANKWGGNGGKPLAEVPFKVLSAALEFFGKKLLESEVDNPSLAHQVRALELVHAWRGEQPASPDEQKSVRETLDDEKDDLPFPQEAAAGEQTATAAAVAEPAKAVVLALPVDLTELKRWSSAQLQAKLLDMLKDPLHAGVRAKHLAEINAGEKTHHRLIADIGILVEREMPAKAKPNARGEIGTLPGEHD